MAVSGEKLKEPLDESEKGEWKAGLPLNIKNSKIITSCLITSLQIDRVTVEAVTDFLGFQITVDDNYSQETKRCLLLGRKAMKYESWRGERWNIVHWIWKDLLGKKCRSPLFSNFWRKILHDTNIIFSISLCCLVLRPVRVLVCLLYQNFYLAR